MKALIHSVNVESARGEFTKVHLELWIIGDNIFSEIWQNLKPGAVLTEFGIGDPGTKETKITLPSGGRKLYLE